MGRSVEPGGYLYVRHCCPARLTCQYVQMTAVFVESEQTSRLVDLDWNLFESAIALKSLGMAQIGLLEEEDEGEGLVGVSGMDCHFSVVMIV